MTCLGIDEAGRGPILGPLVMAGFQINQSQLEQLRSLGVQDSKLFGSSPKAKNQRAALATSLQQWPFAIEVADSAKVDSYVQQKGLNRLEREMATILISKLPSSKVMLDGAGIFAALCQPGIEAQNKADQNHLEVAAASIIAKHHRDQLLEGLLAPYQAQFGPIKGGGYANQGTLAFVTQFHQVYGQFPPFFRASYQWKAIFHLRRR